MPMKKHIQHNKDERRHSSLEKYASHFIERVVCERHLSHSSIFSPTDLNSNCSIGGPEDPLYWVLVLFTASYLQLARTSCAPSYIIVLRPLNSIHRQSRLSPDPHPDAPSYIIVLRPLSSTRRQSRLSPDILNRMHLLFTQVHFLFW